MNYEELIQKHPDLFSNQNSLFTIIKDFEEIKTWEKEKKWQLKTKGLPENWGTIGVVYDDPYITILRDLVRFPDGNKRSYFRILNSADLKGGKGTVILPVFQNKILLLHQFRHTTRKWHWEAPRGFGEPNISAENNAKKEISEEIEGTIKKIVSLGGFHSNTGIEGAEIELFLAELDSFGHTDLNEGIDYFKLFTINEVEEMIRDGIIKDGFTIGAYTRAKLRGLLA
jgi:ADP-ribose pyrophosphatase